MNLFGWQVQKSEFMIYLFFLLGASVAGLDVADIISPEISTILLGLLGFAGYAGLREFLNARRLTTIGIVIFGGLGLAGLGYGIITPAQLGEWFLIWGFVGGSTLGAHISQQRKNYFNQRN